MQRSGGRGRTVHWGSGGGHVLEQWWQPRVYIDAPHHAVAQARRSGGWWTRDAFNRVGDA